MKHTTPYFLLFLLSAALVVTSCSKEPPSESKSPPEKSGIESLEVGTTRPLHRAGTSDVLVAGQPGSGDFKEFKSRGVNTVINLRRSEETPELKEEQIVTDLGMAYVNPGFSSPDALNDDLFDQVRAQLNEAERPILLHCASANRASSVWLPYRVLDQKVSLEQALNEAETMGLRSESLKEKALQYIEKNQEK